jgi:putative phosphoesterase
MKIALLSDVHANLPALEVVLADAAKRNADAIWNAGDFVGYGAFPDEVVRRLREAGAVSVLGNYDEKVLQIKQKGEEWKKSKHPLKWLAFKWAFDQLSDESRAYLISLHKEQRLEVEGRLVLIVHGSPASIKEHLSSETPEKRLKELARIAKSNVIICGHSHRPFNREVEGAYFINPGSVGRSDEGDPRACYALLELKGRLCQVQHFRLEYDVAKTVEGIRAQKLPEEFAEMFIQGRTLDEVLAGKEGRAKTATRVETGKSRERLAAVMELAKKRAYEADHSHQVARLALMLFEELRPLHGLGNEEKFLLQAGALLHDVGWIGGQEGHHKKSFDLIMAEPLPFTEREKTIIALIARYHRKGLPEMEHPPFAALDPEDRRVVRILAGIVRVADGLDRSHTNQVQNLKCKISLQEILIKCDTVDDAAWEAKGARKKADLLESFFERKLAVECNPI